MLGSQQAKPSSQLQQQQQQQPGLPVGGWSRVGTPSGPLPSSAGTAGRACGDGHKPFVPALNLEQVWMGVDCFGFTRFKYKGLQSRSVPASLDPFGVVACVCTLF